jgi:hypothetical protein
MTEEKIINWRAMDSRQRDQLMVEKVLGYSLELVQDSIDKMMVKHSCVNANLCVPGQKMMTLNIMTGVRITLTGHFLK